MKDPKAPRLGIAIREADGPADLAAVRQMFVEYAEWFEAEMGHDLCFQGFDDELAGLPAPYQRPGGSLWVAQRPGGPYLGAIAVKPLAEPGACEMKRLFVRDVARGTGLGRRLVEASLRFAREVGYHEMKLDTLRRMVAARRLYEALGFREVPPYVHNPIEDVIFLAKDLD